MPRFSPRSPLPKTPPQIRPKLENIPRLEIPRFDSHFFRNALPGILGDFCVEENKIDASSIDLGRNPEQYTNIRDAVPEWDSDDQDDEDEYLSEDFQSRVHSLSSTETLPTDCPGGLTSHLSSPGGSGGLRGEGGPSLEDFLINITSPDGGAGVCIRRSDGRIYAIKKILQTRQAWTELAILEKVKDVRNSFCPLLHWTFERGHYIYLIMDNYPSGTLEDAIGRYGVFGPLEVFFYACEIIVGLQSLHDVGVAHRNISPSTIIFDRHGHIILSGIEHGIILRPQGRHPQGTLEGSNKQYQAPELLLGWSHDFLVDSWSFGMVLYYMFHGKHAFLSDAEQELDVGQLTRKIMCEGLPITAIRFINPIARDLILKCIERNPAMRPNIHDIQCHPYFSNADWKKVIRQRTPAPLPRDFRVSNVIRPSSGFKDASPAPEQCFSPRMSAFWSGSHQQSFGQAMPQCLRSPFTTPGTRGQPNRSLPDLTLPLAQSTMVLGQVSYGHGSDTPSEDQSDALKGSEDFQADGIQAVCQTHRPLPDIWESLDREEQLSVHSNYSVLSTMKMPFSRAWNLRKERSLIQPHRLFNLSTASIQQKLRRRPKSVAALKCAAYAAPIADLPSGLNQIGSGIAFTYTAPPPALATPKPPVLKTSSAAVVVSRGSGPAPDPGNVSAATRNSMASDCTVPVPKACHGLLRSLSMSSLWTGFKSGPVGVHVLSVSPLLAFNSAKKRHTNVSSEALDPSTPAHGYAPQQQGQPTKEEEGLQTEFTPPLAESTAIVSPSQVPREVPSPMTTLSTGSTTSEEDVLTPETVGFRRQDDKCATEQEIVELKRSEEALGFGPELTTLRLVTPLTGLRLSFTSREP